MTDVQQRTAAKEFAAYWGSRGDEKQETQRFWLDLLRNVYSVAELMRMYQKLTQEKGEH